MKDYLFEIIGEDSDYCGMQFFVECEKEENPWKIVGEYFDDEEVIFIGEYTSTEADALGYDTYY